MFPRRRPNPPPIRRPIPSEFCAGVVGQVLPLLLHLDIDLERT